MKGCAPILVLIGKGLLKILFFMRSKEWYFQLNAVYVFKLQRTVTEGNTSLSNAKMTLKTRYRVRYHCNVVGSSKQRQACTTLNNGNIYPRRPLKAAGEVISIHLFKAYARSATNRSVIVRNVHE